VIEKRELVRIVRTQDGVFVDPTGKMSGRGAYLHNDISCWEKGLSGSLARSLKTQLTDDDKSRLLTYKDTISEHLE
jgi:predicted RNA-binding protein YlxR (DUF448 family)